MTEMEYATKAMLRVFGQELPSEEGNRIGMRLFRGPAGEHAAQLVEVLARAMADQRFSPLTSRTDRFLFTTVSDSGLEKLSSRECLYVALAHLAYVDSVRHDRGLPVVGKRTVAACRALRHGGWLDVVGPVVLHYFGCLRSEAPQLTWLFDIARFYMTTAMAGDCARQAVADGSRYPVLAIAASIGADAGKEIGADCDSMLGEVQAGFASLIDFLNRPLPE